MFFNIVNSNSNYRLRDQRVALKIKKVRYLRLPGNESVVVRDEQEEEISERHKSVPKAHEGRGQRAAKLFRPVESIRKINMAAPAPLEVAVVRMQNDLRPDPQAEQIAALEARIKVLLGLVNNMAK